MKAFDMLRLPLPPPSFPRRTDKRTLRMRIGQDGKPAGLTTKVRNDIRRRAKLAG